MLKLRIFAYSMSQTGKKICIYIVDKIKFKINGGLCLVGKPPKQLTGIGESQPQKMKGTDRVC